MKAIILAAGFSTRMRASGIERPKSLLEIENKPVIEHVLGQLIDLQTEIVVVTNSLSYDSICRYVNSLNNNILVLDDGAKNPEERLGAVRDIAFGLDSTGWDQDTFIFACDTVTSLAIKDFVSLAKQQAEIVNVVYDTGDKEMIAGKLGCVVTKDNQIIEFYEKPVEPHSTKTSIPYYYFPKDKLPLIREFLNGGENGDSPGMLLQYLMARKVVIKALEIDRSGYYMDVRDGQAFEKLRHDVKNNRIKF